MRMVCRLEADFWPVAHPMNQDRMSNLGQLRVAIGMPVFNGEKTVANAIESITRQTYSSFKLIISDNASTDATPEICTAMAAHDSRIVYVRQNNNIGAAANFDYVLRASECEYFMWAAADDVRSPDFLAHCVAFLDHNSDYVGAICPVRFKGKAFDAAAMGDFSLEGENPYTRMLGFVGRMHANGRFYSLFRHDALAGWLQHRKDYLGADWTLVLRLLHIGKMSRLAEGWTELGVGGTSRRLNIFAHNRKRLLHWPFPFFDFSRQALCEFADAPVMDKARLLGRLARINAIGAIMQVRYEILLRAGKRRFRPADAPSGPLP